MEFEEMKVIWDSQNNEPLFAINQGALHKTIQSKGAKVNRTLNIVDWVMMGVNLFVGLFLIAINVANDGEPFEFLLPILYLFFFGIVIYRRFSRRQESVKFEPTIRGDLDHAIWQTDYLIRQGQSILVWYLLPLMVAASIMLVLSSEWIWAIGLIVVVLPMSYFGSRWEINKFYMPKKRELEALRQTLIDAEASPK